MPRFYIPPDAIRGGRFTLSGSEAHHAVHVLRKKVGDILDLFDGKDTAFKGRIDLIQTDEIEGAVLEDVKNGIFMSVELTLYQALTRGAKWDWLIEKSCEIGVTRIVPVLTERCIPKVDFMKVGQKSERWNRVAMAAAKQCGRSDVMKVEVPVLFPVVLATLHPSDLSVVPWEKETKRSITDACKDFRGKRVNIFIGPEGGWEAKEIEQAIAHHATPVRLGPTLLRTETAGLVAATLALREFGIY